MDKSEINRKIRLVAQGDADALASLYVELRKGVYGLALSILRDRGLAEDCMQNTFLKIRLNAEKFDKGDEGKAWILRIARNEAYDCLRKQRDVPTDDLEAEIQPMSAESDDEIARATNSIVLRQAMKVLSTVENQVVYLHLYCDLKHKDVAEMMEIPVGTAGRIYSEAIGKLRRTVAMKDLG
jgi:RNA polymerase sigma-70 factor (ECF subfamily)